METLVGIGFVLATATVLCAIVESMALERGRQRAAWTIASFIGLCLAFVGWIAVAGALLILGPTQEKRRAQHPPMVTAVSSPRP
jgi:hypothetical protein